MSTEKVLRAKQQMHIYHHHFTVSSMMSTWACCLHHHVMPAWCRSGCDHSLYMTSWTFKAPLLWASLIASRPFDSGIALVTMLLTSVRILGSCKICRAGWKGPHLQTNQATCCLVLGKTGCMLVWLPNMQLQATVSTRLNAHIGMWDACMHA